MAEGGVNVVFSPSEELDLIRSTARQFLEERVPMEIVRRLMMSDQGFERGLWKEFAELGWLGLAIPEEYGGAGYGLVEMGVVLEEMGRLTTPGPFLASAVLAATAVMETGDSAQRDELLTGMAGGETIATLAVFEGARGWSATDMDTTARKDGGGWIINGLKPYVLDGHLADLLVVAASTEDGVGLFVVPADAGGVKIEQVPVLDPTRRQASVRLDSVNVGANALLGQGRTANPVGAILRVGVVALASEQLGGAARCLEMSVEHAKSRYQFGRPIGSFQAIKHRCAQMLVRVENARSAAHYATRVAGNTEELAIASPLAGSVCSEAYLWAAAENIQIHGGVGFTWDHDAHIYLKRAKATSLLLGDPRHQRDLMGRALKL